MGTGVSTRRGQGVYVLLGCLWQLPDPSSEAFLRSGFILFLFLLFLTFAEGQKKMPRSLFSFLYLLARSRHFSFGYLQPMPSKCHIWVSPCRGEPFSTNFGSLTITHLLPAPTSLPRAVGRQGAACAAGGYLGSWSCSLWP